MLWLHPDDCESIISSDAKLSSLCYIMGWDILRELHRSKKVHFTQTSLLINFLISCALTDPPGSVSTLCDNLTYISQWNRTEEEDWEWDALDGSQSFRSEYPSSYVGHC